MIGVYCNSYARNPTSVRTTFETRNLIRVDAIGQIFDVQCSHRSRGALDRGFAHLYSDRGAGVWLWVGDRFHGADALGRIPR